MGHLELIEGPEGVWAENQQCLTVGLCAHAECSAKRALPRPTVPNGFIVSGSIPVLC